MNLNDNIESSELQSEGFNLNKALSTYTRQWKWFVLSLIIAVSAAFIYIRYTTPEYSASAKIKLIDENEGSTPGAVFSDLSLFADSETAKVEDEIQILKSRKLFTNIVKKLNLNTQYFSQGRIYETELYSNIPFEINFIAEDSIIDKTNFNFYIEVLSDIDFNYKINEDDSPIKKSFGENISSKFGGMIITPANDNIENLIGKTIRVKISPINNIAIKYKSKIDVYPIGKSSKIVGISLDDPVISKAKDIINEMINEYVKLSIEEKTIKSEKTAKFINERIDLIATDLSAVDDNDERFRTGNKLTNVTSEADLYLSASSQMEQELANNKTQLNIVNFLKEQVDDVSDGFKPISTNVESLDPAIASSATRYNSLINNRENLLKTTGEKNQIIVNLDQQLNGIRNSLRQSLDNSSKTIGIKIRGLQNQSQKINSKIYAVPGQTRKLKDIQREQITKETLYLYLLQKREEAAISLAATSAKAIVVEDAYSYGRQVFPDKKIVYIAAMFIGLLLPFSIVYVNDLLDTKIHNKEDLNSLIKNITVLGEVPKVKGKDVLVKKNDRSILSESFRIIRTNFDYIQRGRKVEKYNNVIFVTSTINGEGKSFFSMNMALTLANTNKRVLLIGADVRNPKLLVGLDNKSNVSKVGLTEYLIDKSVTIGEAINTSEVNGNKIDVLLSGKVPPNPAELLMSDKMKPLFDKASEQYDYVIVDTAPSMLVTDTLLFSQYAGHTIYMTRADYTEKRILNFAKELHAENKLNGMMLVVNDVKQSNFGYGAKYGYYGAKEKKGFFRRNS